MFAVAVTVDNIMIILNVRTGRNTGEDVPSQGHVSVEGDRVESNESGGE